MKSFKVERVRVKFSPNSSETLREETEKMLNQRANEGYELVSIDFELAEQSGYIYSYIVFKR